MAKRAFDLPDFLYLVSRTRENDLHSGTDAEDASKDDKEVCLI